MRVSVGFIDILFITNYKGETMKKRESFYARRKKRERMREIKSVGLILLATIPLSAMAYIVGAIVIAGPL